MTLWARNSQQAQHLINWEPCITWFLWSGETFSLSFILPSVDSTTWSFIRRFRAVPQIQSLIGSSLLKSLIHGGTRFCLFPCLLLSLSVWVCTTKVKEEDRHEHEKHVLKSALWTAKSRSSCQIKFLGHSLTCDTFSTSY